MGKGGRAFARVIVQLSLLASFVMWSVEPSTGRA